MGPAGAVPVVARAAAELAARLAGAELWVHIARAFMKRHLLQNKPDPHWLPSVHKPYTVIDASADRQVDLRAVGQLLRDVVHVEAGGGGYRAMHVAIHRADG